MKKVGVAEVVTDILCKNNKPAFQSHHNIIISEFTIPCDAQPNEASSAVKVAPKIVHSRVKIHWTDDGESGWSLADASTGGLARSIKSILYVYSVTAQQGYHEYKS